MTTLKELRKKFSRCGLSFSNKGLECTFYMKRVEKMTCTTQDDHYVKATFSNGKYLVQVTSIKLKDK